MPSALVLIADGTEEIELYVSIFELLCHLPVG